MNHRERHPEFDEGCWACKVTTISVSAHATPNRRPEPVRIDLADKRLERDLAAYRRLRHGGFQPQKIDGSADWERAEPSCQFELDTGHMVPKAQMGRVQETIARAKDMGIWTDGGGPGATS